MIYQTTLDGISAEMLTGFFQDWGNKHPTPEKHRTLLEKSSYIVLAIDEEKNRVVGYTTAISDGVLAAYIPFLEVLPAYKNKGIGKNLVSRMLDQLSEHYMVDLCCDDDLVGYYEQFQMTRSNGMIVRRYSNQSGI